jgi:hypothetical protein
VVEAVLVADQAWEVEPCDHIVDTGRSEPSAREWSLESLETLALPSSVV